MSELFPVDTVTMDSPRLRWIKRHGVHVHYAKHLANDPQSDPYCAWLDTNCHDGGIPLRESLCGFGKTEDDAFAELARVNGLRLWNEETE